jgi:hypothetical protein
VITKNKLYNGEVELVFDSVKHTYEANGEIVFGVTSITGILDKPALLYWVNNTDCEYLDKALKPGMMIDELSKSAIISGMKGLFRKKSGEAADIGTMVHDYLEKYLNAGINGETLPEMPINPHIRAAIKAFLGWTKENKVKFIAAERKVYSKKYKYAGTLDALGYVNGKLSIIDFKTSSGIYDDMFVQTSAYAKAVEEEDNVKVEDCYIVRVPKDGSEFEVQRDENLDLNFKSFLGCHENYKRMRFLKKQAIDKYKVKLNKAMEEA